MDLQNWMSQAKAHWQEFQPTKFKELKQSGSLGQALQDAAERTYQEMNALTEAGFAEHEAWEMVRESYLFPPEEAALKEGADQWRRRQTDEYNRNAARVENYLNDDLATQPEDTINRYMSSLIALELDEKLDLVRDVVFGIDCGHNGVTIVKGDFQRAIKKPSTPPNTRTVPHNVV